MVYIVKFGYHNCLAPIPVKSYIHHETICTPTLYLAPAEKKILIQENIFHRASAALLIFLQLSSLSTTITKERVLLSIHLVPVISHPHGDIWKNTTLNPLRPTQCLQWQCKKSNRGNTCSNMYYPSVTPATGTFPTTASAFAQNRWL